MKLRHITVVPEEFVSLYHEEHGYIQRINEYTFNLLRAEIHEDTGSHTNEPSGYYIKVLNSSTEKFIIDNNGRISNWTGDWFTHNQTCLRRLLNTSK